MIRALAVVSLFMIGLVYGDETPAHPVKSCEECPQGSPCTTTFPPHDRGNHCWIETWCIAGKWYQSDLVTCTLVACEPKENKQSPPFRPIPP